MNQLFKSTLWIQSNAVLAAVAALICTAKKPHLYKPLLLKLPQQAVRTGELPKTTNSIIYLANNKGLLRYNGAQWDQFPTPDNSIMRSVKAIGNRVYSGSYMDFGYWSKTGKRVV